MKYIRVEWLHSYPDDPIVIYSEVDDERWEHRKVEVFRDKRTGFADEHEEAGGAMLGLEPWPNLEELGSEPEFEVSEITKAEFEALWKARKERLRDQS